MTAARLELVEGVGSKRALRLAAAFEEQRRPLLTGGRAPDDLPGTRPVRRACGRRLGASATRQLREDPWRLLSLPQLRPDQADWFARQVLGDAADPQDRRRGRALVAHLLTRGARDGIRPPAEAVARSLGRFRISDPERRSRRRSTRAPCCRSAHPARTPVPTRMPAQAQTPAPHTRSPPRGVRCTDPAADTGVLLALTRYALAEEAVAEGLQRLAALAEPLPAGQPGAPADQAQGNGGHAPEAQLDQAGSMRPSSPRSGRWPSTACAC